MSHSRRFDDEGKRSEHLQGSPLEDLGAVINRYIAWMASGPVWRWAVGIGGPILVVVLIYQLVFSGGGSDSPSVASASPTAIVSETSNVQQASASGTAPAASTTGAARTTTPGSAATTLTPGTTGTAAAAGSSYVVKSGDTLGAVCSAVAPSMSSNACVAAIVQLNKLTDAGQLQVGQQLILPVGTPGVVLTAAPTSTPAASPVGSPTQPAATATRIP